jgi:hypothetical protein
MGTAKVPRVAAEYFKEHGIDEHPTICHVFHPEMGWRKYWNTKVSGNEVRQLRREGYIAVALKAGGRVVDFRIEELSKR